MFNNDMEVFVNMLLKYMHEYQIKNNIKSKCLNHTLFFVDACNNKKKNYCKYEVGCVFYIDNDNNLRAIVHCWCSINGKIIEPSYEVSSIKYKKVYYNSIKDIFNNVDGIDDKTKKWLIKQISWFNIQLLKCSKNKKYCTEGYNELQDFIINKFNSKIDVI